MELIDVVTFEDTDETIFVYDIDTDEELSYRVYGTIDIANNVQSIGIDVFHPDDVYRYYCEVKIYEVYEANRIGANTYCAS